MLFLHILINIITMSCISILINVSAFSSKEISLGKSKSERRSNSSDKKSPFLYWILHAISSVIFQEKKCEYLLF